MAEEKKRDDPSTTSKNYDLMLPRWEKSNTLLGGTEAMRAAGESFLPQHPEETAQNYDERLMTSTLFNMYELTLEQLSAKPFSEPVAVKEDVPEAIVPLLEDIDLQGNDINVFARQWFKNGLAKAFSHVLVMFPQTRTGEETEDQPRTLADDAAQNVRPFWVQIPPENLFFAAAAVINGREVLTHIRIFETETIQDGFAEREVQRIRIIEPGTFQVLELKKVEGEDKWVPVEEGTFDLDFIPLVTFYSDREDLMLGKPKLTDLADLNITHWQSSSDQRNILTVARFPMLAVSGALDEDGDQLKVGPRQWLHVPDPAGKFYYVEHSGKAIDSGRTDLNDLEEQMASYGAELLKRRPGNATATARAIDEAEVVSPLEASAITFQDALNTALSFTAQWLKIAEGGGTVEVVTDFNISEGDTKELDILKETRKMRDISRPAYLEELKRRDVLSEDYDIEADGELITEEAEAFTGGAGSDIDPGQTDDGTA